MSVILCSATLSTAFLAVADSGLSVRTAMVTLCMQHLSACILMVLTTLSAGCARVMSTPMLFRSGDHASDTVMDPAINGTILGLGESKGIVGLATGTVGAGAIPGLLRFQTASAAGTITTAAQFDSSQNLTIGSTTAAVPTT